MAILYIGLGFAMISGISAMMQIGNNVNNLMLLSTFKQKNYYESSLPSYDRQILDILNNYSGSAEEVCSNVKANISDTLYQDGDLFLTTGTQALKKSLDFFIETLNKCGITSVSVDVSKITFFSFNSIRISSWFSIIPL